MGRRQNDHCVNDFPVKYFLGQSHRGYLFFSVKDRNLFHRVDTIGNIFTVISRYPSGKHEINRGYLVFLVKNRNLFHPVDTIGNIFTSGIAMNENITDGIHQMK